MTENIEQLSRSIYYQLIDLFEVSAIYSHNNKLIYKVRPKSDNSGARQLIEERLKKSGFEIKYTEYFDDALIEVSQSSRKKLPRLHIILFIATLISIFLAPFFSSGLIFEPNAVYTYLSQPEFFMDRLEFTIALIAILLFHEFGHYFTGRKRGVLMSLPYFLPAPNIAGTFGAIIKSRSPILNRRDLIEVGSAGPIAGFVISVIALVIGLQNSQIVETGLLSGLSLGDSLLLKFLTWLIVGPIPDGYDIALSPASFAGWVGLLVTMLNLLPMGQLDGGHIVYGLFGRAQHIIGKIFAVIMIALGFYWPGWWIFGIMIFIFKLKHPPTIDDEIPIPFHARLMGFVAIAIFAVSFIPIPFDFA
ncbi:MAG: site-2 protease family protein [Candidatus Zixiibacteriota bacterium]